MKSLFDFLEWTNHSKLAKLSSNDFMIYLVKPNTLSIAKSFLLELDSSFQNKIPTRIFMTAFLIYYHPNEFLSKDRSELEELICRSSKNVINTFQKKNIHDDLPKQLKIITFAVKEWIMLFQYYQQKDKQDLLQQLAKYHKEVRNFYQDDNSNDIQKELLSKIENLANSIGGSEGISHVQTSSQYGMIDEKILFIQLDKQMREAFWDIFDKDMLNDPPNFKQFPDLIDTIANKMINVLPNINKENNTELIKQNLNKITIQKKIQTKTYSKQDIYNILFFALEKLKELHNAISQSKIDEMLNLLDKEMQQVPKIQHSIPKYLRFIIEELEIIEAYKNI